MQYVLYHVCNTLNLSLAPILPYLAEEVNRHLAELGGGDDGVMPVNAIQEGLHLCQKKDTSSSNEGHEKVMEVSSVHLRRRQTLPSWWEQPQLEAALEPLFRLRERLNALEEASTAHKYDLTVRGSQVGWWICKKKLYLFRIYVLIMLKQELMCTV